MKNKQTTKVLDVTVGNMHVHGRIMLVAKPTIYMIVVKDLLSEPFAHPFARVMHKGQREFIMPKWYKMIRDPKFTRNARKV